MEPKGQFKKCSDTCTTVYGDLITPGMQYTLFGLSDFEHKHSEVKKNYADIVKLGETENNNSCITISPKT